MMYEVNVASTNRNIKRLYRKLLLKLACRSFLVPSRLRARICAYAGVNIRHPNTVFIGDDVLLDDSHPELITIGKKVWITNNVKIYTHFLVPDFNGTEQNPLQFTLGSVIINDYVYIGSGAMIVKPVTVGEGAIIAAGSVITKNVEPYTIVAGVPARVVGVRPLIKNETK